MRLCPRCGERFPDDDEFVDVEFVDDGLVEPDLWVEHLYILALLKHIRLLVSAH